jgi:hypothetical protein
MDALDLTWSSLDPRRRPGQGPPHRPAGVPPVQRAGQGASIDLDQEVYEGINLMSPRTASRDHEVQFDIRVEQHHATIEALKTGDRRQRRLLRRQTFGLTGDVAVTATEVAARNGAR